MQIITLLNQCYRFPGFAYHQTRLSEDRKHLEMPQLIRSREWIRECAWAGLSASAFPATGQDWDVRPSKFNV